MGALQSSTSEICRTSSAFSMIGAGVAFLSGVFFPPSSSPLAFFSSSPFSFFSSSCPTSSSLSPLAAASVPFVSSVFSSSDFFSPFSPSSAPSSTFFSLFFRGVLPDHNEGKIRHQENQGRGLLGGGDTCCDEMGRGDFGQLKEFPVGEGKVADHCDLVSAWLLTLGAGERFRLHIFFQLQLR